MQPRARLAPSLHFYFKAFPNSGSALRTALLKPKEGRREFHPYTDIPRTASLSSQTLNSAQQELYSSAAFTIRQVTPRRGHLAN